MDRYIRWQQNFCIKTGGIMKYLNNPINIGDVVLDCGAAEGAFALLIAQKCQKVYAIEPHPLFIPAMKKTFHGINNIEILPIGVGEVKGLLKLSMMELCHK